VCDKTFALGYGRLMFVNFLHTPAHFEQCDRVISSAAPAALGAALPT
jgi:hypothetical protein